MKVAIKTRYCNNCGNSFALNPRIGELWAEKTGRGRYCSRECYYDSRKGVRVSPSTEFKQVKTKEDQKNHPRYLTGIWSYRKWKKAECEDCKSTLKLHVHHIDRDRNNNELNNLKTLCKDCHWNYHRGNRVAWNKGKKLNA